jgi:hypothetical protein
MSEEEKQERDEQIRRNCIEFAIKSGVDSEKVVEKATEYYEFITGSKNL